MLSRLRRSIRRKRRATYCVTCEDSECGHVACGINRADYENVYYSEGEPGKGCDANVVANGRNDVRRRSRGGFSHSATQPLHLFYIH